MKSSYAPSKIVTSTAASIIQDNKQEENEALKQAVQAKHQEHSEISPKPEVTQSSFIEPQINEEEINKFFKNEISLENAEFEKINEDIVNQIKKFNHVYVFSSFFLEAFKYVYKENTENQNITDVIIAKHRNGPVKTIQLYFDKSHIKFENLAKDMKQS